MEGEMKEEKAERKKKEERRIERDTVWQERYQKG
jgi:hypothetical protein